MRKFVFIVLVGLMLLSAVSASGYHIYTEIVEKSQFFDEAGSLTGSSVEIVNEIRRRLDDTTEIEIKQWADAYNTLMVKDDAILFPVSLTEERKDLFKWAGPILRKTWSFFVRKDSGIVIHSMEDAKALKRMGTITEDAREQYLLLNGFQNTVGETDYLRNVQKLHDGEVDAIIESPVSFYANCVRGGLNPDDFQEAFVVRETDLYIAFSKNFPEAVYLNWRNTLDGMYEDGTFETIYRKWYPDTTLPVFTIVE